MSVLTRLVKMAVKWTPKVIVLKVANVVLKGIAHLTDFNLDLDARKVYAKVLLEGESEAIEVLAEGFAIAGVKGDYQFMLLQAQSNKIWLNNLFSKIVGKPLPIPHIPRFAFYMDFAADLLKPESAPLLSLAAPDKPKQ